MGSMKTLSTGMNLLTIVISVIYSYYLLTFIDASGFLWALWTISIIVATVTTLLGVYARDEYYIEEFEKILNKIGR